MVKLETLPPGQRPQIALRPPNQKLRGAVVVLGDVTLVADNADGLEVLTDNRVSESARAERTAADAYPSESPEKDRALVRMKHAELASRNTPGGFWVAAADPDIVTHALTGEIPVRESRCAALLSDGAARAVVPLGLFDWPGLLATLRCARTRRDSPPGADGRGRRSSGGSLASQQNPR